MIRRHPIAARTACLSGSIIDDVAVNARAHGAVDLAFGAPETCAPPPVKEAAAKAIHEDRNQYSSASGDGSLRQALAVSYGAVTSVDPDEEITVTCGTTEAMFTVMMALIDPGDEIIVFEPFFDAYIGAIRANGGVPRYVPLRGEDWCFDAGELEAAFTMRTKAVIVTHPHNPTGKVFRAEELSLVVELCAKSGAVCVSDEIYARIIYDGRDYRSLLSWKDEAAAWIVVVGGFSKAYSISGWRLGYVIAPAALTDVLRTVHSLVTFSAPTPFQSAALAALALPEDYYRDFRRDLQHRRDRLTAVLEESGFRCRKPAGACYIMAETRHLGLGSDMDFCDFLIHRIGVACVPGRGFYSDRTRDSGLVRFCFWKSDATLREAERRLIGLTSWTEASRVTG